MKIFERLKGSRVELVSAWIGVLAAMVVSLYVVKILLAKAIETSPLIQLTLHVAT